MCGSELARRQEVIDLNGRYLRSIFAWVLFKDSCLGGLNERSLRTCFCYMVVVYIICSMCFIMVYSRASI
jgi:hypothetical protein